MCTVAAVALLVSIYYAYSLRLLNYNGNNGSVQTGKSLQQLVPDDGYLFYFHGADYIDPEYLYYARRRGVLYDLVKAENGLIGQTIKDHKWDPGKTYLLALGFRVRPDWQEKLKQKLDQYDLKEIGTSYDDGVVYKITPRS